MHCDMQFLVVKISTLPCVLNGVGTAVSVLSYNRIEKLGHCYSIITSPYGGLQNDTNFFNSIK